MHQVRYSVSHFSACTLCTCDVRFKYVLQRPMCQVRYSVSHFSACALCIHDSGFKYVLQLPMRQLRYSVSHFSCCPLCTWDVGFKHVLQQPMHQLRYSVSHFSWCYLVAWLPHCNICILAWPCGPCWYHIPSKGLGMSATTLCTSYPKNLSSHTDLMPPTMSAATLHTVHPPHSRSTLMARTPSPSSSSPDEFNSLTPHVTPSLSRLRQTESFEYLHWVFDCFVFL